MKPNPHIALIYHYDLARALNGEPVDWVAIPVNVDAGREGGDLCRAAADFAKRRDLFAMPAPTIGGSCTSTTSTKLTLSTSESSLSSVQMTTAPVTTSGLVTAKPAQQPTRRITADQSAVPAAPTVVEQQAADPEPSTASTTVPGTAAKIEEGGGRAPASGDVAVPSNPLPHDRERLDHGWLFTHPPVPSIPLPHERRLLIQRIKDFIGFHPEAEQQLRRHWPEGVPTLKHDGHTDAQLQLLLACVRRVEAEVGAGWHPDDGPPPHVNTDPRASVEYPAAVTVEEGGPIHPDFAWDTLKGEYDGLDADARGLCAQVASEAHAAGRSISVTQHPTVRRWSIARAVIAWAASGRTLDELWFHASMIATFGECKDSGATLGGLISQFTIEQADRLYQAAQSPQ